MKVEVKIRQISEVDIEIQDVIDEINEMPIEQRMNIIGHLFNGISTEELLNMSSEHIAICRSYLQRQLNRF